MPEYLAPGVYVEEIPSGNKPIQPAGTSTAGMVGMTARGPVNTPTLVSSLGEYNRKFGGSLNPLAFTEGRDALPYSAEGFFINGGARLFVVRVVGPGASEARLAVLGEDTGAGSDIRLAAAAGAGDIELLLEGADAGAIANEASLLLVNGLASEVIEAGAAATNTRLRLDGARLSAHADAETVIRQQVNSTSKVLTQNAEQGATTIEVNDGAGITDASALHLGTAPNIDVVAVSSRSGTTIELETPLRFAHLAGAEISTLTDDGGGTPLSGAQPAASTNIIINVADPSIVEPGDVVRIGGDYLLVSGPVAALTVGALTQNHAAGVGLVPAATLLTAHARYPGVWGNDLMLTARPSALLETATVSPAPANASTFDLQTAFGLFLGSIVIVNGVHIRRVVAVNTETGSVTLDTAISEELPAGTTFESQEFALIVDRVENGKIVESESFDRLSMAATHPRYAPKIVGRWDTGSDRPSVSGGSALIRLSDDGLSDAQRFFPAISGVGRMFAGGGDDAANVDAVAYVGAASDDPGDRTGIQALENESAVNIVAVPGQTSVTVQKALIAHCDKMRYRFAVLDTPLGAKLEAAKKHRQNFDTTRAALYYPGLEIADRFGEPGERRALHPSGHVLGVYARTDIARGVHKAPANEVVRGVLSFDTKLTKGEQDILNPINLNCLRDFRAETRGLRVYGARVATSDPEWRYVNVRRLLLFIEQSLDTGLQWAVFEPNAEPLWATLKQSVAGFLTTVWRDGALEGTKAEEAFFINVGFGSTMTQDDVDNGRVIIEVGVAPVKPAEFVILRISQKTREAVS